MITKKRLWVELGKREDINNLKNKLKNEVEIVKKISEF